MERALFGMVVLYFNSFKVTQRMYYVHEDVVVEGSGKTGFMHAKSNRRNKDSKLMTVRLKHARSKSNHNLRVD